MFRLKHSLFLLLVLVLAACGTQPQLPEGLQNTDDVFGQLNAAELEQAFDVTALSAQGSWNKVKYNKFTLKKVVVGDGPKHQTYKVAVVCKVPHKEHLLVVVGAAYLKDGKYQHVYVPKQYVKCAAIELETFGEVVKFGLEQSKNNQSSNVAFKGKLRVWGKHLDFKGSKFFHLKHGEAKFIVINEYELEKKLELKVIKKFQDQYDHGTTLYPKDYYLDLKLICEGREPIALTLDGNLTFTGHYSDLYGKKCYVSEKWYDDEYKFTKFSVAYDDGKTTKRTYNDSWKVHEGGKDYEYAQNHAFYVDRHAKKLVIVIVNLLEKKEQEKKLVLKVIKKFDRYDWQDSYHYPQAPKDYDTLKLQLVCDGVSETINLDDDGEYYDEHASDLYGKKCYIEERFKDDKYKVKQVVAKFEADGKAARDDSYGDTYYTDDDYREYETGKTGDLEIKHEYKQIVIIIINKMVAKHPYS